MGVIREGQSQKGKKNKKEKSKSQKRKKKIHYEKGKKRREKNDQLRCEQRRWSAMKDHEKEMAGEELQ